jgi:hypothetical protein
MQDIGLVSLLVVKVLLQFDQVEINICIGFLRTFSRLSKRLSLVISKTIVLIIRVYIISF